jgi:hypothetical protein
MGTVLFFCFTYSFVLLGFLFLKNRTVLNPNFQKPVAIKDLEMILP